VSASGQVGADTSAVLEDILAQEITPELVPTVEGTAPQATEDSVGPYALADFALYHLLRRGARPRRIAFLAWHAWHDADAGEWPPGYPPEARPAYDLGVIRAWLEVFCRRFFASQFKRSALPNAKILIHQVWTGQFGGQASDVEIRAREVLDLKKRVEQILAEMCGALSRGENVKISGFGTFVLRDKGERVGRNPKTGEEIPISARTVVTFRPGQKLKERVEAYAGPGQ
jgi:integration host factor alpha subunit